MSSQQSLARGASLVETFDLREVTEEALRLNQTQSRSIDRASRRFDAPTMIVADKHELLQVLVNLVRNAVRAVAESSDPARHISIAIDPAPAPGRVSWQIEDTGVGISAEQMTRS